jgi:hypothetical protein
MSVAVVVPQYKTALDADETVCVRSVERHLSGYDRFVVSPESLRDTLPGFQVARFPDRFFRSSATFATLQLRPSFYRRFAAYEHLLMVQLDALVLSDRLAGFCAGDYDYVGAPWIGAPWFDLMPVGNGGFSLRRVSAFLQVLESRRYALAAPGGYWRGIGRRLPAPIRYRRGGNSDVFWSLAPERHKGFRVADVEEALRFAWELSPRRCFELTGGELPFGAHAWTRYDREFWEPYLPS